MFDTKNIDFNTPQLVKITDAEYFSIGSVSLFNHKDLVLSASTLKSIFSSDAYEVLIKENKFETDAELQYIFDVGSGFYTFILENSEFNKRYYIAEYKELSEKRTLIKTEDFEFIQGAYEQIKLKYPYILEDQHNNEMTILSNIDGAPYRAKLDKIIETSDEMIIIDLKSIWFDFYAKDYKRSADGIRWKLVRYLQEMNYDIQCVAYTKAMETLLNHNNIHKRVVFKILMASKKTNQVKMVEFGSEMMENGLKKFDFIFPELKAFYEQGVIQISKDEVI